jgi:hypothetical protein
MKKTLLFICTLFSIALSAQTQRLRDLVKELNDKTQKSASIHFNSVYYISVTFTTTGFTQYTEPDEDGNTYTFPESGTRTLTIGWGELEAVGPTDKGRVGIKTDADSNLGHFFTPVAGVAPREIVDIIQEIYGIVTNGWLSERNFTDEELAGAESVIENNIMSNYLEITGRSSGIVTGTPDYDSNEYPYEISDLRLMLSFGKRFRFDLGILGYSWMDLPEYTKYNTSGDVIGTDTFAFGSSFWTPSLGFTYAFMVKPDLGNHVMFEFPLSVSFAPMLFGSNSDWDDEAAIGETAFEDVFAFSYVAQGSLGATIFLSKDFGLSLKGGAYYFGVNATSDAITHTNAAGVAEEYTIKFNEDETNIKPFLEFGLKFRWE